MVDESEDDLTEHQTLQASARQQGHVNCGTGMLSKTQREYLHGTSDIEQGSAHERTVRSRIRERTVNSVWDLACSFVHLDDRDVEQVADSLSDSTGQLNLRLATKLLLKLRYYDVTLSSDKSNYLEELESDLERDISDVYMEVGQVVEEVDVNINISFRELDESADLDDLTVGQVLKASHAGMISDGVAIRELMERGGELQTLDENVALNSESANEDKGDHTQDKNPD